MTVSQFIGLFYNCLSVSDGKATFSDSDNRNVLGGAGPFETDTLKE